MQTPNELWRNLARRRGNWQFEVKVNLLAIRDFWVDRKRKKRLTEAELYSMWKDENTPLDN